MSKPNSAEPYPVTFDHLPKELRSHTRQGFFGSLQSFVYVSLLDPSHVTNAEYLPDQRFLATTEYHVVVLAHVRQEGLAVDPFG